jgi:DNA helicase-2/ATP-dependent DNA helicase PcrA
MRAGTLTELTLDPRDATSDEAGAAHRDEDYLILSTIHSAKGQEWSAVFLLNAVDGCIPSDLAAGETEEIEKERRLLYVAMTGAKHQPDIVVPQRFYVHQQSRGGDSHLYVSRTRFLPDTLLGLFEQRTWPMRTAEPGRAVAGRPEARVDIAARLRARWR